MPSVADHTEASTEDEHPPVTHVRYRGAFGVSFFWHHAVVVGAAPAAGCADERTVFHWSGGASSLAPAGDKWATLAASEICAVPWATFQASANESEHAQGVIETVLYSADVLAANPPSVQAARARALLGHRGLLTGVDRDGNDVPGYNPLTNNCESYAVYVMTGTARSLQADTALAVAGAVGNVVTSLAGEPAARLAATSARSGADLSGLALVAGIGLGVLALSAGNAEVCPSDGDRLDSQSESHAVACAAGHAATGATRADECCKETGAVAVPRNRTAHTLVVTPPGAAAWSGPVVRSGALAGFETLPLAALSAAGCSPLNVEVLCPDGSPHVPQRRWLCVSERHDALPFGLCYGHRLHAEPLADEAAAPFLALPSFQFWFEPRPGGRPPRGLRGVLLAAPVGCAAPNPALFGLDHLRRNKFMCAGTCTAFPGTEVDTIFHLGVTPATTGASVTLTLADYTESTAHPPVDEGFALRWVQPGEGAHVHRSWPYFACTPEGFLCDSRSGVPGPSHFRFWLREAAASNETTT